MHTAIIIRGIIPIAGGGYKVFIVHQPPLSSGYSLYNSDTFMRQHS